MKKYFILTIIFILTISFAFGQNKLEPTKNICIKGRVYDMPKGTGRQIPYATVWLKGTKIGAHTDSLGYYSIDITAIADTLKNVILSCSYIGCATKEIVIKKKIKQTTEIDFELKERPACEYHGVGKDY